MFEFINADFLVFKIWCNSKNICNYIWILVRIFAVIIKRFFLIKDRKSFTKIIFLCHYQSVIILKKTLKSCINQIMISFLSVFFESQFFICHRSLMKCWKLHARNHVIIDYWQHLTELKLCNLYRFSFIHEVRFQYVEFLKSFSFFNNNCLTLFFLSDLSVSLYSWEQSAFCRCSLYWRCNKNRFERLFFVWKCKDSAR